MAASKMIPYLTLMIIFTTSATLAQQVPCPFNGNECMCEGDNSSATHFDTVMCTSLTTQNPIVFNGPASYYSAKWLRIYANVAYLPPRYLSAFSEIQQLELVDTAQRQQRWSAQAFDGPRISQLNVVGLNGMLPPPPALRQLGTNGLQYLYLSGTDPLSPVPLLDSQFSTFTKLTVLSISYVPISVVGENAFSGLEQRLESLLLLNTSYPSSTADRNLLKAVAKIPNLKYLFLAHTGITHIPTGYFSALPKLKTLLLADDNLANSSDTGAFYDLPPSLWLIMLNHIGLTRPPKLVFSKDQEQPLVLELTNNAIGAIGADDLRGNTVYDTFVIKEDKLSYIDISTLANLGKRVAYDFVDNMDLKYLTASSFEEIPRDGQVTINPALEWIDPNLANSFVRYPQFTLDISHNQNLDCENLVWMMPYVLCWKNVRAVNAYCSSGQLIYDYFMNIGFNCSGS